MSGIRAIGNLAVSSREPARDAGPSTQDLEDMLYDMVSTGVDPAGAPGMVQAVQAFLHEHARKPKSLLELKAFFEAHALPMQVERIAPTMDSGMPPLTLQPLALAPTHTATELPAPRAQQVWIWSAAACALLVLGTMIGLGYSAITQMHDELTQVRAQASQSADRLTQVQAEAESLRAAARDNAATMRRVDHKSDLLIRSLLSPLDPDKTE